MSTDATKPTNPKDLIGTNKVPLSLFPATAVAVGAVACLDGALKYGRDNYRAIGVRASIYVDACKRHLDAWMEGEDCAKDSKVPHLGHALACIAIIVDAQAAGMLTDDRKIAGGYRELLEQLTPLVAQLREQHAGKTPKHYTIADSTNHSAHLFDGGVNEARLREAVERAGVILPDALGDSYGTKPAWICGGCGSAEQWDGYARDEFVRIYADSVGGRQCNSDGCTARTPA